MVSDQRRFAHKVMTFIPRFAIFVAGGFLCLPLRAGPPPEVLSRLADDSFKEREAAQSGLLDWAKRQPGPAKEWLFQRSRVETDPEARRRCLEVLRSLVVEDYLKEGKGYVGILMQSIPVQVPGSPNAKFGIRITMVVPDSPAAKAGLTPGGVIVGVNDQVWGEPAAEVAFSQWIQSRLPGSKVTLKLLENGKTIDRPLELGRRPDDPQGVLAGSLEERRRVERAAQDHHFQQWLEQRKARK